MNYSISLIDKAAEMCGSYYRLAKRLKVSEANISHIRHGRRPLPLAWAYELAEITGEDKGQVLQLLTMEQAKAPEKRSRLGKLVAAGVVAICSFSYGNDSLSQPVTSSPLHQPLKSNATVCTSYCF